MGELEELYDRHGDAVAFYLIGRGGRVAFQGERGPEGFKPADLAHAIETELG